MSNSTKAAKSPMDFLEYTYTFLTFVPGRIMADGLQKDSGAQHPGSSGGFVFMELKDAPPIGRCSRCGIL